jgi:hypothetical protein
MRRFTDLFLAAIVSVALCATAARGQYYIVTTEPASPSAASDVTLVVFNGCNCPVYRDNVIRQGFVLSIPYQSICFSACLPIVRRFHVGRLEAGSYTVRQFSEENPTASETIGTFVVSADIPVFSRSALLALCLSLAVVSILTLRSRG